MSRVRGSASKWLPQTLLPLFALVSTFTSHPGKVPGDTKLYLYLDPARLMSDSIWSWDMRQFGGWVPHQNVGYLWPSGPFFALFESLGLPDWVTHRIWLSVLISAAGLGAFRLGRHLGLSISGAFLAAMAYQFTPYVLPYISRTSALLLPWSLLAWLILVAIRYDSTRRIRFLALFALLIASSGGLNATALIVLAPGPIIWMMSDARRSGRKLSKAFVSTAHLGIVSILSSAWWLAGLFVQGRYGASVLSYSEALVSTSATSTAPEVLRGLGYWLFYDRGPVAPLTSASAPYQDSLLLIALGGFLVVLGLLGIARSTTWRPALAASIAVGVFLSVGAFPFDDPSPLFSLLADHPKNALSLALRSSTRAVPLVVLAIALGIGFAASIVRMLNWRHLLAYSFVIAAIVGNLPASFNGDLVDRAILRPENLPSAWIDAARFLDERFDRGHTGSVLLVPGIESAAYRWGYPVDPILPGISKKPFLSRDWLPLGSPALMDLLYALDDSFQNGTPDVRSIAPVARMLGADTVMLVSSHQYERFGTIDPSRAASFFDPVPEGLTRIASFGEPESNQAEFDVWSEERVAFPRIALPEIQLFSVDGADEPTRLLEDQVVVAADGTGLVDLAASSLLSGGELVLSEASLDDDLLLSMSASATQVIVSDSNRRRAHHWRGSQEVWGATEPLSGILDIRDDFDSRLPINSYTGSESQTIVESAPVEATATAYGAELRYHPEFRPRSAVDGDDSTAWRIGPDRSAIGHVLTVRADEPLTELKLLQPLDPGRVQWITRVSVRIDGRRWAQVLLDDRSLTEPGQIVPLETDGRTIEIRIDALNRSERLLSSLGVGFAEVLDPSRVSPEVVLPPRRLKTSAATRLLYSFNRLRSDPFDRWRSDPETAITRRFVDSMDEPPVFDLEVRLNPRASDAILASQLGIDGGVATQRLNGSARWWGPAAFDRDPTTSWWSPVSVDTRAQGLGSFSIDLARDISWIEFQYPTDSPSSRPRSVELTFFRNSIPFSSRTVSIPDSPATDTSRILIPATTADSMTIEFMQVDPFLVVDSHTRRLIPAPVAVVEMRSDAWDNAPLSETFDTGCRTDLLTIGGQSIPIRLFGSTREALDGSAVDAELCSTAPVVIEEGSLLSAAPGSVTGWNIDRIAIGDHEQSPDAESTGLSDSSSRGSLVVQVPSCSRPCAVEAPFGYSSGWSASLDGESIGAPMRTAAGRSVWLLPTSQDQRRLTASWDPQKWIWAGLGTSAITVVISFFVLVCLLLRRFGRPCEPLTAGVEESNSTSDHQTSFSRSLTAATSSSWTGFILTTASGSILISPTWGLLSGCSFAIIRRLGLQKITIAGIGLGFLFVVLQQIRTGASPGFAWPSVFETAHRPMLAAVLVFSASMIADTGFHSNSEEPSTPMAGRISFRRSTMKKSGLVSRDH